MTDQSTGPGPVRGGDRRGMNDRRRTDRRAPTPYWRRPWAYAAYGVIGAVLLMLLFGGGDDDERRETGDLVETKAPPPVNPDAPPAASAPVRDAYGVGDYERLLAEGGRSLGQRVRTELYCGAVESMALSSDAPPLGRSIGELADANRRVPAAECKWGATASAPDFLLLVPPAQAQRFAASPEVVQGFIRRRRVRAEVEWVGRSEALALRNVGVLRTVF